ncbi:MAG: hypothetical protein JO038_03875 [Alphaproteobacteria bacterium]|nr:hypothetical protein [Alphaproteobacteria bacterium]
MRWMNGPARHVQQRRRRPPPPSPVPRPIATEELVACERCGTYVSAAALHCGRPGCPRPRP